MDIFVSDELHNTIEVNGQDITREATEVYEKQIEFSHRPSGLTLDNEMVYNLAHIPIPDDLLIGLSFGPKFLFPFHMNASNSHRLIALVEFAIDGAVPAFTRDLTAQQVCGVLKGRSGIIQDPKNKWLSFIKMRIDRFLRDNPDVVAIKSDKGNHTVVMHLEEYRYKVRLSSV